MARSLCCAVSAAALASLCSATSFLRRASAHPGGPPAGVGAPPPPPSSDPCESGRNVTFFGPWSGGDAWLVNYTGPFDNDRPPHVQLGPDPAVHAGQVACLSACSATTSKAIEWEVDGVWNAALNQTAHITVFYGSGAAKKVSTYCAPAGAATAGAGAGAAPAGAGAATAGAGAGAAPAGAGAGAAPAGAGSATAGAGAATAGALSSAVTCKPGTYYKKYGPACGAGEDCCPCVAGDYCPGDQGGYQKMFPCPAGTCSPPRATSPSQCVAPACAGPAPSAGPHPPPPPAGGAGMIHLSLSGVPTEMQVSFAIADFDCKNVTKDVAYGTSPAAMGSTASAEGYAFQDEGQTSPLCTFTALLTGLAADTAYYYSVDGGPAFSFRNQPARAGGRVYAVLGDMGLANDVAASQIVAEAQADEWDAIIYSGDFAYDLNDNGGETGNQFMNVLQPAAATKALMSVVGNHEEYFNFSQWKNRFYAYRTAAKNSGSSSPFWYSFDDGLAHFACINTELYEYGGADPAEQLAWLEADLKAVDRTKTPWLLVNGHKNAFMPQVDFSKLDALLRKYGVDLYMNGHAHNYQRIAPFEADLKTHARCSSSPAAAFRAAAGAAAGAAPPHVYAGCSSYVNVVVGSPGNREIASKGDDSRKAPASLLDVFSENFGFAHMTVVNATALLFQWEQVKAWDSSGLRLVPVEGAFADEFYITR